MPRIVGDIRPRESLAFFQRFLKAAANPNNAPSPSNC